MRDTAAQQKSKNEKFNRASRIRVGSKYEPAQKATEAVVHLEPLNQPIGKKAVPWKTQSNFKGDFSYQILL
jgi:hypothetical protein